MKKVLVLVQSKYGASRQYARWLAERIASDLAETKNFDPKILIVMQESCWWAACMLERWPA